jgi:hypothetical protein
MPIKNAKTVANTRHAARKDERNMRKHPKARRGQINDDFS